MLDEMHPGQFEIHLLHEYSKMKKGTLVLEVLSPAHLSTHWQLVESQVCELLQSSGSGSQLHVLAFQVTHPPGFGG